MINLNPSVREKDKEIFGEVNCKMNRNVKSFFRTRLPGRPEPSADTVKLVFAQLTSGRGPDLENPAPVFTGTDTKCPILTVILHFREKIRFPV